MRCDAMRATRGPASTPRSVESLTQRRRQGRQGRRRGGRIQQRPDARRHLVRRRRDEGATKVERAGSWLARGVPPAARVCWPGPAGGRGARHRTGGAVMDGPSFSWARRRAMLHACRRCVVQTWGCAWCLVPPETGRQYKRNTMARCVRGGPGRSGRRIRCGGRTTSDDDEERSMAATASSL